MQPLISLLAFGPKRPPIFYNHEVLVLSVTAQDWFDWVFLCVGVSASGECWHFFFTSVFYYVVSYFNKFFPSPIILHVFFQLLRRQKKLFWSATPVTRSWRLQATPLHHPRDKKWERRRVDGPYPHLHPTQYPPPISTHTWTFMGTWVSLLIVKFVTKQTLSVKKKRHRLW
jgi:hypothetical protein